MPHTIKQAPM